MILVERRFLLMILTHSTSLEEELLEKFEFADIKNQEKL